MKRNSPKIVRILWMLLVLNFVEIVFIGATWFVLERRAINTVADHLNIEPRWSSFDSYMDEQFQIGMTRKEIILVAREIGRYNIVPLFDEQNGEEIYCDIFSFGLGPFRLRRGNPWVICYDEDNIVIDKQILRGM